ncbi:uncharacterized protein LOC124372966 isoform X2 [Homalodisca vitripennis]|uniref:uncharacterized protein LOC124372966 isoform X2 n=1 Tax=Homalodisca vitripennis TaxID=197043 RepID=UPI001EEA47EB|nr:uncharacterized protein LOC124372966 isoform X2 [Homalodisca vitripennis]KAG8265664.1 hypothetical protein J6590_089961 [Homalodisca vitripennis]
MKKDTSDLTMLSSSPSIILVVMLISASSASPKFSRRYPRQDASYEPDDGPLIFADSEEHFAEWPVATPPSVTQIPQNQIDRHLLDIPIRECPSGYKMTRSGYCRRNWG